VIGVTVVATYRERAQGVSHKQPRGQGCRISSNETCFRLYAHFPESVNKIFLSEKHRI